MADVWVCANCRSVNKSRAKQCYQCRTPKDRAAVDPLAIESTSHGQIRDVGLPTFHSSKVFALVASAFIAGIVALEVVGTLIGSAGLTSIVDPSQPLPVDVETVSRLGIATLLVGLLALVSWSLWLSRVVKAMPALGLGYPAATGLTAFIENFIPGLNLLRVPAIVRDVVRRLEPRQGRVDALIFAAWIGLIGGLVVPRVGFVVNVLGAETLERAVRNAIIIESVAMGLVVVGAIFLVALIWWIEVRISRRRWSQLAEAAGRPSTTIPAPAPEPAPAARASATRYAPPAEQRSEAPIAARSGEPWRSPAPAVPAPASMPEQEPARPPFVLGPTPDILSDVGPRSSTGGGSGPRLGVIVQADGQIVAELEGESETVTLDELREAAAALAQAGGSAIVTVVGEAADVRWTAREAAQALRDQGVPTDFED